MTEGTGLHEFKLVAVSFSKFTDMITSKVITKGRTLCDVDTLTVSSLSETLVKTSVVNSVMSKLDQTGQQLIGLVNVTENTVMFSDINRQLIRVGSQNYMLTDLLDSYLKK